LSIGSLAVRLSFKSSQLTLSSIVLVTTVCLVLLLAVFFTSTVLRGETPSQANSLPTRDNQPPSPSNANNSNNTDISTLFEQYPELSEAQVGNLPLMARQMARVTVQGPENAKITVVEYGAYGCSICRRLHRRGVLSDLRAKYPAEVRVAFVSWPTSQWNDKVATEAVFCALDQSHEAFQIYHEAIFDLSDEDYYAYDSMQHFLGLADDLGLDSEKFSACMRNGKYRNLVFSLIEAGTSIGLSGTPVFFVNGTPVSYQSLEDTVAAMLASE
jgi:protein-disulfide isomerase